MNNEIVNKIPGLTENVMNPKKKDDSRDAIGQLELLNALYLHEAIVTAVDPDHTDTYRVDVYDRGFTKPDGTDESPTRIGLIAHAVHSQDWFIQEFCGVGKKILVHVLNDNTCWIKHPEEPALGVVVCQGCNGEAESTLPKNYYWVQFARIWNTDDALPHQFATYQPGSISYNIVPAENLFERNCKTHHVRPGTVIVLKWNLDNQNPTPSRRYYFEVADEGTCAADPCKSSSSSSSSSGDCKNVCWFMWEIQYDCLTYAFGVPHVVASGCYPKDTNPFTNDPVNVWIYDGPDANGTKCLFHYVNKTEKCCSGSIQCEDPTYPGDPSNPSRCCGSSSSGSGSVTCDAHCVYTWTARWDCIGKAFYEPDLVGHCLTDQEIDGLGEPINTWVSRGQNVDGECVYVYHQKTTQCCIDNTPCHSPPPYPGDPPNPDQCCPGYKSSGASGGGPGGGPTVPCNAIKDIRFECIGRENVATIVYCDGTSIQKKWPCCCDNPPIHYRSGSHSGSGSEMMVGDINCYHGYSIIFNCRTLEVGSPDRYDYNCGDPIDSEGTTRPLNTWFKLNQVGDICVLAYWIKSTTICDPTTENSDCQSDPKLSEYQTLIESKVPTVLEIQALCGCEAPSMSLNSDEAQYYRLNICYDPTGEGTPSSNEYIPANLVPSTPFFGYSSSNNRCYAVPTGALPVNVLPPGATIHTTLEVKTNCSCGSPTPTPTPTPTRSWQELRDCTTNLRVNKWIETTGIIVTNGMRLRDRTTGKCYYVLIRDPDTAIQPTDVIATWDISSDSCADCQKYWRTTECGGYALTIYYITDTVKRYMETHGLTVFKLAGDVRCFKVDMTTSYTGLGPGGVIGNPASTYASCPECMSA